MDANDGGLEVNAPDRAALAAPFKGYVNKSRISGVTWHECDGGYQSM